MRFVAAACVVSAGLAGCSGPPLPASARLPPMQTSVFDGAYRGGLRVTAVASGVDPGWCQTQTQVALNVASDQFSLSLPHPNVPGSPTLTFAVAIAPGGSFQTQSQDGTASFVGQVAGAHLQGTINGAGCQYAVSAERNLL